MNIFLPQSIQSQIELEEIADVKRQIISPSTSNAIIGIVQDGLLGAYNLTSPHVRIDWKNAMNIMSYTSMSDFKSFKKDKEYTGHELFSLIVPSRINVKKGDFEIQNGTLKKGYLSKDFLGFKKNVIHQMIWDEYGVDDTMKFLDDTQRLTNNFNLFNGFSVGIGDAELTKSIETQINNILNTKDLKINNMITEIENNPDLMPKELFERTLFAEANSIRDDVSKLVMNNLSLLNNFGIMVKSGSRGDATQISQIIGCIGPQAFEGGMMPKKVNQRSLPFFFQNDDRPDSRGLIRRPFLLGMSFPEFFYLNVGARQGLIDGAVKSVTGDTRIIIQEDGNIKQVNIGDWINGHLDNENNKHKIKKEVQQNMELFKLETKVYIPTTDEKGKVTWGEMTHITRHDQGKELYEVKTHGGRSVKVPESKSLLIWDSETEMLVSVPTPDIKLGDLMPVIMNLEQPPTIIDSVDMTKYFPKNKYIHGADFHKAVKMINEAMVDRIQIPRGWWEEHNGNEFTLPYENKAKVQRTIMRSKTMGVKEDCIYPFATTRECATLPDKFKLDEENGIFIGLFLADGNVDWDSGYVQITKDEKSVIEFVKKWFGKYNIKYKVNKRITERGTIVDVRGYSRMLCTFLNEFVGHGAANKYVPDAAFNAPIAFVKGIINGYISGDGTVDENSISVTSVSEKLIQGIGLLCNRLGIFGKIYKHQTLKNNLGTENILPACRLNVRSKWATIFKTNIKLVNADKQSKLRKISCTKKHTNFDSHNDIVLDEIISITKIDNSYKKLYDVTVPSTLNFSGADGLLYRDTAESGYIQRKLVKSLEDAIVRYDCTVRTANNAIIQFVYGDTGANTTKQYEYNIKMIEMGDKEIMEKYKIKSEDLTKYNIKAAENDAYYNEILAMRDLIRGTQIKHRMNTMTMSTTFMIPVNFPRILDNMKNDDKLKADKEKLDAKYIITRLKELLENANTTLLPMKKSDIGNTKSIKYKDEMTAKTSFKIALHDVLAPAKCLYEYKFTKAQFDAMCKDICDSYNKNIVEPGEMVGVIGAQALGEPSSQMSSLKSTQIRVLGGPTNHNGSIGEFIDGLLKKHKNNVVEIRTHKDSVVLDLEEDYYILGVSDKEKTSWKRISQVSRHPANGKLVEVHTRSGRVTTATLSHSFLKRTATRIESIKGSELKIGDRIPVASNIKTIDNALTEITIGVIRYKLTKELGWLCGAYLADGDSSGNTVRITKVIPEFIRKIVATTKILNVEPKTKYYKHNGFTDPRYKDKLYDCASTTFVHKEFAQFLQDNFGNGSYNKFVSAMIYGTNADFISGILAGYFDGDGNADGSNQHIRVGSRSKQLINDIAILFSYHGIFGSIVEEKTINCPGKILYTYSIQRKFAHAFKRKIGLVVKDKIKGLDEIIEYNKREDIHSLREDIDKIPELGNTIASSADILNLPGKSRTYRRWKKKPSIGRGTLGKYIQIFTKAMHAQRNTLEPMKLARLILNIRDLEQAYKSDVVWDEIVELRLIDDPKEYVYDFTVPGNDTFMVDCGILVHNTLKSFHASGIASIAKTTQGVPRVKELLSLSKKIKTPQMCIYPTKEYMASNEMAKKVASHIVFSTLGHIKDNIVVYYDPEPYKKGGFMEQDNVTHAYYTHNPNKNSCQPEINNLPWLMRIELNKEKMLDKEVTLLDIKSKFCNAWEKRYLDKNIKKEDKYVFDRIAQLAILSNTDNDKVPTLHIRFEMTEYSTSLINNFIDQIIEKFKLKGISSITDINTIDNEITLTFDNADNAMEKKKQYVIYTQGVNLYDIRYINGIDPYKTVCNDVIAMYETFGIEAARASLLKEITLAYELAGAPVNYHHLAMLVDLMTRDGHLTSIDRHGMNKSDVDPLSRASFEQTVEQLLTAAVFGEVDHMKGVSSRIMAGLVIKGGTGLCDVILDTEMIEKSEFTEDIGQKYQKTFVPINKSNINEHIAKEEEQDIFMPE